MWRYSTVANCFQWSEKWKFILKLHKLTVQAVWGRHEDLENILKRDHL